MGAFVYSRAAFILGPQSPDIEDATTDAYINVLEAVGGGAVSCEPQESCSAWLTTVSTRVAIDHYRRRARTAQTDIPFIDEEHETSGGEADLDLALDTAHRGELVRALLTELEPEHREVIVLRYWEDLTQREIALRLGLPEGTVKSRLHRAEARLRAAILKVSQSGGMEPIVRVRGSGE
ncbi:RNA polymerase sigma factor [Chondromyces apiculatus]|uniref:RNA polymerase sigma-70 factor n=1 Tax=Chondromyces apiculatus DSM 436 TaxID=1192034 RepID=A0A017T311_9BACT|nr:sigma-70 family RNA polymerase sigma factor [Chondromyces apiculatus]EYF03240.1 RNA polymerase sigma-70 factor [Chondromyces apiculatus DSM 436]